LQNTLKLRSPFSRAHRIARAVGGVVVSKPIAKKATSRPGSARAMRSTSSVEYTLRMSAPAARALSRLVSPDAGTRSRSA
jgi:hypothetical protein